MNPSPEHSPQMGILIPAKSRVNIHDAKCLVHGTPHGGRKKASKLSNQCNAGARPVAHISIYSSRTMHCNGKHPAIKRNSATPIKVNRCRDKHKAGNYCLVRVFANPLDCQEEGQRGKGPKWQSGKGTEGMRVAGRRFSTLGLRAFAPLAPLSAFPSSRPHRLALAASPIAPNRRASAKSPASYVPRFPRGGSYGVCLSRP